MTSTPSGPIEYVRANREKALLLIYFAVMVGLAAPLANLIARGWWANPRGVTQRFVTFLGAHGLPRASIEAFVLGLVFVALVLMTIDRAKRVQGVLLWLGVVGLAARFWARGFVPAVMFDPGAHLLTFGAGIALGLWWLVPTTARQHLLQFEVPKELKFGAAPRLLYRLLLVAVVVMLFEAHVEYPALAPLTSAAVVAPGAELSLSLVGEHLGIDLAVATVYVGVARLFMGYETDREVLVLGPSGSGKTFFLHGSYLEWLHRKGDQGGVTDTSNMLELADQAAAADGGAYIENTAGAIERSFTIQRGEIFPQDLSIESLDYKGEDLKYVAEAVADGAESMPENASNSATRLFEALESADTLIVLVDVDSCFTPGESMGLEHYEPILREYGDQAQVLLAATKADYLASEFKEQRNLDAFDSRNIDRFGEYVSQRLQGNGGIRGLLDLSDASEIYPTYFLSEETATGERDPTRDEQGSLQPYGFVKLLSQIK